MDNKQVLIPLTEYCSIYKKDVGNMRRKAGKGDFKTAKKMAGKWYIDKNEKPVDNRVKTGLYRGWRDGIRNKKKEV